MDNKLTKLLAKTTKSEGTGWHPLILHMLDVAASTEAILAREPGSTRETMAATLGMEGEEARPWLLLVVACHDLGKACPGFQCKCPELLPKTSLRLPRLPNTVINHAFVSQIALTGRVGPNATMPTMPNSTEEPPAGQVLKAAPEECRWHYKKSAFMRTRGVQRQRALER
jgi:CRISPR-associated endonuclease Cas3-HD